MGIPSYWQNEKLGSLATQITKGTTPTTAGFQYQPDGVPFIKVENIIDGQVALKSVTQFISPEAHSSLKRSQFQVGDVLFSIAGTIGKTALVDVSDTPANTNQAVAIFRGVTGCFIPSFLKLQLQEGARRIQVDHARGGAMNNVSLTDLKGLTVSVPPLAEQKIIADKLDTLLAQVENTKARLERIPQILKRFRQSVLAAAVSGRLTEEWREREKSLQWVTVSLKDVAEIKDPHPSHRTPKRVENGIPYIGIGDLKPDGSIDFENARTVSEEVLSEHKCRYQIKLGDFIFGKIGTLGKVTTLPTDRVFTLSANVILIQPKTERAVPSFLMYFLSAPGTIEEVARQANSTSQAAFGIKKMRAFVTSLPSLEEQTEIVRRVDQLFSHADRIEQQVNNALARVNNLTQSILAKAFRGELTEQWRKDNPELISGENSAEALLERIKAERAAAKPAKRARSTKRSN